MASKTDTTEKYWQKIELLILQYKQSGYQEHFRDQLWDMLYSTDYDYSVVGDIHLLTKIIDTYGNDPSLMNLWAFNLIHYVDSKLQKNTDREKQRAYPLVLKLIGGLDAAKSGRRLGCGKDQTIPAIHMAMHHLIMVLHRLRSFGLPDLFYKDPKIYQFILTCLKASGEASESAIGFLEQVLYGKSLKLLKPRQSQQLIKILSAIQPTITQLYEKQKIIQLVRILNRHTPVKKMNCPNTHSDL